MSTHGPRRVVCIKCGGTFKRNSLPLRRSNLKLTIAQRKTLVEKYPMCKRCWANTRSSDYGKELLKEMGLITNGG